MFYKIITFSAFSGALITLLGLSYWQVERLQWKQNIIEQLDVEYTKTPQNYIYNFNALNNLNTEDMPIRYGQINGRFNHKQTMLFGPKPHDGKIGYHVLTPFTLAEGQVIVHRGWVSKGDKQSINTEQGTIKLIGIMRKPEWNRFTPNNSPKNNVWSKLDIREIAQVHNIERIAPVIFYTETKTNEQITPQKQRWYPRNKHLQYAIFWFTMAIALVSVFGLFISKNKRR